MSSIAIRQPSQTQSPHTQLMTAFALVVAAKDHRQVTDLHVRILLSYVGEQDTDGMGFPSSLQQLADHLVLTVATVRRVIRRAAKEFGLLIVTHQRHNPGGQTVNRYSINWPNVTQKCQQVSGNVMPVRLAPRSKRIDASTNPARRPSSDRKLSGNTPVFANSLNSYSPKPALTRATVNRKALAAGSSVCASHSTQSPQSSALSGSTSVLANSLNPYGPPPAPTSSCYLNPKPADSESHGETQKLKPAKREIKIVRTSHRRFRPLAWDNLFEKLKAAIACSRRSGATKLHHALILLWCKFKRLRKRSADWQSAPFDWPDETLQPHERRPWEPLDYDWSSSPAFNLKDLPPIEWDLSPPSIPADLSSPILQDLSPPAQFDHAHPDCQSSQSGPSASDDCQCGSHPTAETTTAFSLSGTDLEFLQSPEASALRAALAKLLSALDAFIERADALQTASFRSFERSSVPLGLLAFRRALIPARLTYQMKATLADIKSILACSTDASIALTS